ncbi:SdrD B-like domain-containing protein, partial [Nocardioides sp.]|uniref:SdrD B-like domain-containing protein n=1 Tax=Nocardioides sp. TaxID=35761 RepID=UPI0039E6718F
MSGQSRPYGRFGGGRHRERRLWRVGARRGLIASTVMGLGLGGVVLSAAPASAAVTAGTVFKDFNGNGVYDTTAKNLVVETGLKGAVVSAFVDDNDTAVATATTDAYGEYSLDLGTIADGTALRLEFELPEGYESSTHGGTSVQFTTAGATGVDFAANAPDDYSPDLSADNPPIVTAIQIPGDPESTATASPASEPALVIQPWSSGLSSGSTQSGYPNRTTLATFGEVGALWATEYNRVTNSVYAAATYKRESGLGELGLAGIYRVDDVLTEDGGIGMPGTVVPWVDLTSLGIDFGTALSNSERGLDATTTVARDPDAFAKAGKIGIGGISVSEDGSTMYVANLYDNKIYVLGIDTADPSAAPTLEGTLDPSLSDGQQLWAVETHHGSLFVGYVDTQQAADDTKGAYDTTNAAHVLSTPEAGPGTWTSVLDFPLDYSRGASYTGINTPDAKRWNVWSDTWTENTTNTSTTAAANAHYANGWWMAYHQPILSDLEFDGDDNLIVGLADRNALQGGNRNVAPYVNDDSTVSTSGACTSTTTANLATTCYQTVSAGDTLIAWPSAEEEWTVESDGTITNLDSTTRTGYSTTNSQGPGGGEFFNDTRPWPSSTSHQEGTLGALAAVRGVSEIVTTSFDPAGEIRNSGLNWLSLANGATTKSYQHRPDGGGGSNNAAGVASPGFEKGGGLGDVEALVPPAPIEIGNRVWIDVDGDGVQDPSEPALAGVVVELLDDDGTVLATTVTAADGTYYFSSTDVDGLEPNGGDYTIRFTNPSALDESDVNYQDGTTVAATIGTRDVTWAELTLTAVDEGSKDTIDSDATATATDSDGYVGTTPYTAGGPGENDHTLDAGFQYPLSVSVGDYVWLDTNKDGVQDSGESGIEGVTLTISRSDEGTVTHADGTAYTEEELSTVTDADGGYLFEDLSVLPEGVYYVVTIDEDSEALDGLVPTQTGQGTTATDSSTGSATSTELTEDGDSDLTLDFGFITPAVTVGDYVWLDTDKDGVQDADESGIEGVTLTISRSDGGTVTHADGTAYTEEELSTVTDADGGYLFEDLAVLPADVYYVVTIDEDSEALDGLVPTQTGQGTTATDSSTGSATSTELTEDGDSDLTLDFGFITPTVSVGDYVWIDTDKDGVQDEGEPGIGGVKLTLTDEDGEVVATTTTDSNGYYEFTNLPPGTYTVTIDSSTVPAGLVSTQTGQGTTATDSSTGSATSVKLVNDGDSDLTLDFGFVSPEVLAATLSGVTVSTKSSVKQAETGTQLFDQVQVQGLAAGQTASATATLYGPYASKKDMTCASGKAVKTVSFTATSEWVE